VIDSTFEYGRRIFITGGTIFDQYADMLALVVCHCLPSGASAVCNWQIAIISETFLQESITSLLHGGQCRTRTGRGSVPQDSLPAIARQRQDKKIPGHKGRVLLC
jgi:hypothetical protein